MPVGSLGPRQGQTPTRHRRGPVDRERRARLPDAELGTGAGLIFKGTGFYITDYRSEGYKEAAKKDTAAPAAPAGESKGTGDAAKGKTDAPAPKKADSAPAAPPKPSTGGGTGAA